MFLPNLKYEPSQKKVVFLDLNVNLENGCITIDFHHQALRLSNICTCERFSEACTRYEIVVFTEGILKGNEWFTLTKIWAEKKSENTLAFV